MRELKETFIKLLNNYYSSQLFLRTLLERKQQFCNSLKVKTLPFFLFDLASTKLVFQNNLVVAVIPARLNIGSHDFVHH